MMWLASLTSDDLYQMFALICGRRLAPEALENTPLHSRLFFCTHCL